MTRNAKPRKAYRPGPVHANATHMALTGVRKIAAHDVRNQIKLINSALQQFMAGIHCAAHWRSLADAANMAETLEAMGIGSGEEMRNAIADAQESLAWMAQERHERGTWALRHHERQEVEARLQWLRTLHVFQLRVCSYGEFEQAYRRTEDRVRQARAGNAPRGAIVIEGQLS